MTKKLTISKIRKWNDDYKEYGFVKRTNDKGHPIPFCVFCKKYLVNSSLKPSKLLDHFNNLHKTRVKTVDISESVNIKEKELINVKSLTNIGFTKIDKKILQYPMKFHI